MPVTEFSDHDVEPAPARHAMKIEHEAAQEIQMRFAPIGDQVEIVTVANAAADHQEHDLAQGMGDIARIARIGDRAEMIKKAGKARFGGGSTAISIMGGLRIRTPHGITSTAILKTR